jgi:hypothetical protein
LSPLPSAFVHQHHDHVRAGLLDLRERGVDRLRLVDGLEPLDAVGMDEVRGATRGDPDEADVDAAYLLDVVCLGQRVTGLLVGQRVVEHGRRLPVSDVVERSEGAVPVAASDPGGRHVGDGPSVCGTESHVVVTRVASLIESERPVDEGRHLTTCDRDVGAEAPVRETGGDADRGQVGDRLAVRVVQRHVAEVRLTGHLQAERPIDEGGHLAAHHRPPGPERPVGEAGRDALRVRGLVADVTQVVPLRGHRRGRQQGDQRHSEEQRDRQEAAGAGPGGPVGGESPWIHRGS